MEANAVQKRVVTLDPYEVREETLDALKEEIREQSDYDTDDIDTLNTLVLDAERDGGLDSHAVFFSLGGDGQ